MQIRKRPITRLILIVIVYSLLNIPTGFYNTSSICQDSERHEVIPEIDVALAHETTKTGILNPVQINHVGSSSWSTQEYSIHTDSDPQPSTEVFVASGARNNHYSADCSGGDFLVGTGGTTDFGSPAGTISWWAKWDTNAPHGRFWGQDDDMEMRWLNNRFTLDWGSDNTLVGAKSTWLENHWYFFAITWNQSSNTLSIFWGDQSTEPSLDVTTTAWTGAVNGLLTQNKIMNSETKSANVDGHVDEFRYYDIERSLEEISSDYQEVVSGDQNGLNHYYRFEDDLSDSSGVSNLISTGPYEFSHDVSKHPEGWKAEQVEVSIENLRELYGLNGTFDDGLPGTNEDWSGDGVYYPYGWRAQREVLDFRGRQRAAYVSDQNGYVILENEGYLISTTYYHYNGTRIFWYQTVNNTDLTEEFDFSMDYLYQNGPIGSNFEGNFELAFEVLDGSELLWNITVDLTNSSQRQTWFNMQHLSISIPGAPDEFQIRVVLKVESQTSSVAISETDSDLDGDSTNGMSIKVHLDNVLLVGSQSPSCESVDLVATTDESGVASIEGSLGAGSVLLNHSYWQDVSIQITISSNSSIMFDLSAKVSRMIRFLNSSYTNNPISQGVAYSASNGTNVNLTLYTYLESYPEASEVGYVVYHPHDWQNASIEDPFGTNMTDQAIISLDYVEIPTASSVGWWIVRLSQPNYAERTSTEVYDEISGKWEAADIFGVGDRIRCQISIGTSTEAPTEILNLQVDWFNPIEELWTSELKENQTGSEVTSSGATFGPINASAGLWSVQIHWTNGTAVAFGSASFEVHHGLNLFSQTPTIDTTDNEIFTAAVYLYDEDNGASILSEDAIVAGNWSDTTVQFSPNLAKGYWEADFNSSLMTVGSHVMVVNATMSFYIKANCTINVNIVTLAVMTALGDQFVQVGINQTYDATLRYMFIEGTGIEGADVAVLTWSGPSNGLQYGVTTEVSGETGNYSISFMANQSGTYFITVRGSKDYHSTSAASFYLIVGAIPTNMELLNGSSAVIDAAQVCQISIRYTNSTGAPLSGAEVFIITEAPESELLVGSQDYHGNGIYSITLIPEDSGTFYLIMGINLTNHESQYASFTLSVFPITSFLESEPSSSVIALDMNYSVSLRFLNESLGGLENAVISVLSVYPATGISLAQPVQLGNGTYSIELIPEQEGTYEIVFRATLSKYQNGTTSFTVTVTKIPTLLRTESGSLSDSGFYSNWYNLSVLFERTDSHQNISDAAFKITQVAGLTFFIVTTEMQYKICIMSESVGKWSLAITAYKDHYRNASIVFEYEVKEHPAAVAGTGPPGDLYFNQTASFLLRYNISEVMGIENASIELTYNPVSVLTWEQLGDGYYNFTLNVPSLGVFSIHIRFWEYGYSSYDLSFTFEVTRIPTSLNITGLRDIYYEGRDYGISLLYDSNIDLGVVDAEITISRSASDFFTLIAAEGGWYNFSLSPESGIWSVTFGVNKEGHEQQSYTFSLESEKLPIVLSQIHTINQTYTLVEGVSLQLQIMPLFNDTKEPITNAHVTYALLDADGNGGDALEIGVFAEHHGVYSVNITIPEYGLYLLAINIAKEHCADFCQEVYISSIQDPELLLMNTITIGALGSLIAFAAIGAIYLGRKQYTTMIRKANITLMDLKGRLSDSRNIIALLVIHRRAGLPLYSKILRPGFQELLVSSFITAISQFKSEFSEDSPLWKSIPISEAIYAVQTELMICAIITLEPASERQRKQLESFGKEVGQSYDSDEDALQGILVLAEKGAEFYDSLDNLFNRMFDGKLMKRYIRTTDTIPGHLILMEDILNEDELPAGLSLDAMIGKLILSGFSELKAHQLVLESTDNGYLEEVEDTSKPET